MRNDQGEAIQNHLMFRRDELLKKNTKIQIYLSSSRIDVLKNFRQCWFADQKYI